MLTTLNFYSDISCLYTNNIDIYFSSSTAIVIAMAANSSKAVIQVTKPLEGSLIDDPTNLARPPIILRFPRRLASEKPIRLRLNPPRPLPRINLRVKPPRPLPRIILRVKPPQPERRPKIILRVRPRQSRIKLIVRPATAELKEKS